MHTIITILRKEVASFFDSLVGYVFLGVFLVATGLFVWVFPTSVLESGLAELDPLFYFGPYLLLFMVPAITMRAFSEEFNQGTLEYLVTKPITDWQIIAGKYLASVVLVLLSILPTLLYAFTVSRLGDPVGNLDWGATTGAYIGLFCLGCIFAAIGLFASAVSNNQFVAWILGVFICFTFFLAFELLAGLSDFSSVNAFLIKLGILEHYSSISRGVIDSRDLLYFLSLVGLALVSTHTVLQYRR